MARASFQWFKSVFGFEEKSYAETHEMFEVRELHDAASRKAYLLCSKGNNREFYVGPFEYPKVEELRCQAEAGAALDLGGLAFENLNGNVTTLHHDEANAGAVFQVASQFNCLEMVGPQVRPEDGISRYYLDHTQGPACALCCPAATVFRNYFVNETGQVGNHQLDLLKDAAELLDNTTHGYWRMINGYCLPSSPQSLRQLAEHLADEALAMRVLGSLRVGIHWDTEVDTAAHRVCQVFCSALPIAYARNTPAQDWKPFACLVLDGAYEATLAAALLLAMERRKRIKVFLTALGGGAFGNPHQWIEQSIRKALDRYRSSPLDVYLVHYGGPPTGFYENLLSSE